MHATATDLIKKGKVSLYINFDGTGPNNVVDESMVKPITKPEEVKDKLEKFHKDFITLSKDKAYPVIDCEVTSYSNSKLPKEILEISIMTSEVKNFVGVISIAKIKLLL